MNYEHCLQNLCVCRLMKEEARLDDDSKIIFKDAKTILSFILSFYEQNLFFFSEKDVIFLLLVNWGFV